MEKSNLSQDQHMEPVILYEDDWLMVINKPAGMVVNRSESVTEATVQDWAENRLQILDLRSQRPNNYDLSSKIFFERSGIAHRLDKETSGVLIIAKDPTTLTELMSQFKTRKMHKQYIALTHGAITPLVGWFHIPIKRKGIRVRKFGVDPFGKMTDTEYQVSKYLNDPKEKYTLVNLYPKTGRTHQLRVQLAFYKHPIVGDALYLPPKLYKTDNDWCPRHFLHAVSISFIHPAINKLINIEAPLPMDLDEVIKRF